ncbi:thermonuclease family protein [Salmonella enterica]|nr:thermonuclease family protein [Salmonella enterica]
MKFNQKIILLCIILFSGSLCAFEIQGTVIRVLDGDTIEVLQANKPVRVRLENIDAPEKKQAFGNWSANQLKSLISGKTVTVTYTQTDRYGRVLGLVETKHINVNRSQVISGAAWVYERYNTDKALPALQWEAQMHNRGLWADSQPVPPWEWRHIKK